MTRSRGKRSSSFGLLANGSSRLWYIDIDESSDRENEWSMQIEGPHVYISFQPRDLGVISEARSFLRLHLVSDAATDPPKWSEDQDILRIGKLGTASVSLVWDNEQSCRCFIRIGPKGRSILLLTLQGDEIKELVEAFSQVAEDLDQTSRKRADSA